MVALNPSASRFGFSSDTEDEDEESYLFFGISRNDKKEWSFREWRSISDILKSRHNQIWQARALYMISIAAFVGLSSQRLLPPTLSIVFIFFLTGFTVLLDYKYQILKQKLYKRTKILESELQFKVYSEFSDVIDKKIYAVLFWMLLLVAVIIWIVVGMIK